MVNYQKELEKLITKIGEKGERPRLLVHACCAPCSSYVMEYLSQFFELTMFFYNPNIDSEAEYERRSAELSRLIRESGMEGKIGLVTADYEPDEFEMIARGHENDPERGERCRLCYRLRLMGTAARFLEMGEFDLFCTTLTLSPLKDARAVNEIGRELSNFYLPTDFKKREGFKRSVELSRIYGLYRQDYCGCRFSKRLAKGVDG